MATWATSKATESTDPGDPLADLYEPVDVAIGPGDSIYVADMGSGRIIVYTPEGRPARTIGRFGQGPGEFEQLLSIAVDSEGRIWAGEMGRLQVLSLDGECLALTTSAGFHRLTTVLAPLPDGRIWIGGKTVTLVRQDDDWVIELAPDAVDLTGSGRAKALKEQGKLWSIDLISQLAVRPDHGYWLLTPLTTTRRPYAWLHEYDQVGVLKAEYDVDPACVDSEYVAMKRMLGDDGFMVGFRKLVVDHEGDVILLSSDPPLLCRFDPERRAFVDVREIRFRSEDGAIQTLPWGWSMAIDSRGRIAVTGIAKSLRRVVLQVAWEKGGDAS